jgi:hypothetical protein
MMELKVTMKGHESAARMFAIAPAAFRKAVSMQLSRELTRYIGVKGNPGSWRRKMQGLKQNRPDGQRWDKRVSSMFKGIVNDNDLSLSMGVKKSSGFAQGIAGMQDGYSQTTAKAMPIPNYEMFNRLMIDFQTGKKGGTFAWMMREGRLIPTHNGRVYLDKLTRQPLFFMTHGIRVKKQYDMIADFEQKVSEIDKRIEKAIDVAAVNLSNSETI